MQICPRMPDFLITSCILRCEHHPHPPSHSPASLAALDSLPPEAPEVVQCTRVNRRSSGHSGIAIPIECELVSVSQAQCIAVAQPQQPARTHPRRADAGPRFL